MDRGKEEATRRQRRSAAGGVLRPVQQTVPALAVVDAPERGSSSRRHGVNRVPASVLGGSKGRHPLDLTSEVFIRMRKARRNGTLGPAKRTSVRVLAANKSKGANSSGGTYLPSAAMYAQSRL